MKGLFAVLGLLVTLAIVGVLVKKQLGSMSARPAQAPAVATVPGVGPLPAASVAGSPQQQVQQYQQAITGAMQAPRPEPTEPK